MRAVDTNVLVRLLTGDNPRQAMAAEAYIAQGAWVSVLALAEAMCVLARVYKLDSRALATVVGMLASHKDLILQDADAVAEALILYRAKPRLGFSDCLMLQLARKAGNLPLGTFDRGLGKIEGAQRIAPDDTG